MMLEEPLPLVEALRRRDYLVSAWPWRALASALSARERDVLELLAEGHSNAAIAAQLYVTEAAVGKHVGNILTKLDLPPSDDTNRRVLAVLSYLRTDPSRQAS